MKILYLTLALLLFLPLVSGYIIEIDPEGSSGDVVLATQILLQVDGGRAELSNDLTDQDREDNIVLFISDGEVYLFEGQNNREVVPQRLLQYVTQNDVVEVEIRRNNARRLNVSDNANSDAICADFESKSESCPNNEGTAKCACLNGEWTCDYSSCEVVEEKEEVVVQLEKVEQVEVKKTVWNRIRNFFRNLFG